MIGQILVAIVGLVVIAYVVQTAVRTVILPRASRTSESNAVFGAVVAILVFVANRRRRYEDQDTVLALIAPVGLISIVLSWMLLLLVAFSLVFWATDPSLGIDGVFHLSGSSITTLGFAPADTSMQQTLAFLEAILGLLLLTLLISYLPSIYSAFQRREQKVALLEVRAGSPPSAEVMLTRFHRIGWLEELTSEWLTWEAWFTELEESHTSHRSLPWFRSNDPTRSWVTAAGTVLDAAALWTSAVGDLTESDHASAALCIRAGFISLRKIAATYGIPFDHDPSPDDPIALQRTEFEAVLDVLTELGLPIVEDRSRAWRDFAGWRVNYEAALLGLAQLLHVPYASWTSDRSPLSGGRGRRAART